MRHVILLASSCFILLGSCTNYGLASGKEATIPITYSNKIIVDGNISDWEGAGLYIPLISNLYGEINRDDFAAEFKLSWDEQNLHFMAKVEDDLLYEQASPLRGDGLEFFISSEKGTNRMIQYIIAPGITANFSKPRIDKYDYVVKGPESNVHELDIVTSLVDGGYIIEGNIPWEMTGIFPIPGSEWAINVYLSDVDPGERKTRYALYFNQDTWSNHFAMQGVVLDSVSRETVIPVMLKAFIEDREIYKIRLFGEPELLGKKVLLSDGIRFREKVEFTEHDGIAWASIDIPVSEIDSSATSMEVEIKDRFQTHLYFRDFSNRYVNIEKPNRFEDEILFFEELDKLNSPPADAALFIGSSSIRLWESTIESDFEGVNVICRGFGGSRTEDAVYYFDRIVAPYKPAVIILAEGSNDLGAGDTPEEVVEYTRQFIEKAADVLPGSRVIILSIKVSVTRKRLVETVLETNRMLQEMIRNYDNAEYLDVVSEMLTAEGRVRADIFSSDSTHMNQDGYEIWTRIIKPVLLK